MKTNGKHEVIARIAGPGLVLAAVFALVLSGSSVGRAQSSATPPAVPAAAPAKAAPAAQAVHPVAPAKRQPGGTHEGIKVHGHWMIEVRSPDGKLISHTEFENSLQGGGRSALALLLSGYTPGDWMVVLDGASGDSQPVCTNSSFSSGVGPCGIDETGGYFQTSQCPGLGYQCFPTLTVVNPFVPPATLLGTVTLQGTATAGVAGVITDVETKTNVCYPSSTPSTCQTGSGILTNVVFTAATLPQSSTVATPCGGSGQISCAVTVPAAGDTINVSVTISFQ
jgi:hypothetical protein